MDSESGKRGRFRAPTDDVCATVRQQGHPMQTATKVRDRPDESRPTNYTQRHTASGAHRQGRVAHEEEGSIKKRTSQRTQNIGGAEMGIFFIYIY